MYLGKFFTSLNISIETYLSTIDINHDSLYLGGLILSGNICFVIISLIFGVIKGNLAKWWYGVTAAVTFFAMISFQLYNQESVASIAVSFAVKLVIFAVTIYYTFRVAGKEIEYSDD